MEVSSKKKKGWREREKEKEGKKPSKNRNQWRKRVQENHWEDNMGNSTFSVRKRNETAHASNQRPGEDLSAKTT